MFLNKHPPTNPGFPNLLFRRAESIVGPNIVFRLVCRRWSIALRSLVHNLQRYPTYMVYQQPPADTRILRPAHTRMADHLHLDEVSMRDPSHRLTQVHKHTMTMVTSRAGS